MAYAPGVEDRSGELIAAGISKFGSSLADGLERMREEKKKENDTAALFEKLAKLNPDLLGMDPEEFRGLSTKEKVRHGVAAVGAFHENMRAQEGEARQRVMMERLRGLEMGNRMEEQFGGAERDVGLGIKRAQLEGLTFENQNAPAEWAAKLENLKSMAEERKRPGPSPSFIKAPGSGKEFLLYGNSVMDASGKPEAARAPAEPWILGASDDEFTVRLQQVDDPVARDAIIDLRRRMKSTLDKDKTFSAMELMMMKASGIDISPYLKGQGKPGAAAGKVEMEEKKPARRVYNPKTQKLE